MKNDIDRVTDALDSTKPPFGVAVTGLISDGRDLVDSCRERGTVQAPERFERLQDPGFFWWPCERPGCLYTGAGHVSPADEPDVVVHVAFRDESDSWRLMLEGVGDDGPWQTLAAIGDEPVTEAAASGLTSALAASHYLEQSLNGLAS